MQWPKISFLEFSVAKWGLNAMLNFSLKHSLHPLVTGLYRGTFFSKIFQDTLGSLPSSLSFHTWVDRVVEFSGSNFSRLPLELVLSLMLHSVFIVSLNLVFYVLTGLGPLMATLCSYISLRFVSVSRLKAPRLCALSRSHAKFLNLSFL